MEKVRFVVGYEKSRKSIIINLLVCLTFLIASGISVYNENYVFGLICFIVSVFLLICLVVSMESNWIVKEDCIEVTPMYNISKWKRVFSILLHNQQYPKIDKIYFNDIYNIKLIWNEVPMPPYGLNGYPIYLLITMRNHTQHKLEIYINHGKEKAYPALKYLDETIGIQDQYHIMDNLLDKNIKLAVYIEDIIKKNHLIKKF